MLCITLQVSYSICVCLCVFIYIYIYIYTHTHAYIYNTVRNPQDDKDTKPRQGSKKFIPARAHYHSGNMFVRITSTSTAAMTQAQTPGTRQPASLHALRKGGAIAGGLVSVSKLKKMIKKHQVLTLTCMNPHGCLSGGSVSPFMHVFVLDMMKFTLICMRMQLDPNDPRNYHLLELLSASKEQESEKYVRFDTLLESARIGEVHVHQQHQPSCLLILLSMYTCVILCM